MKKFHPGVSFGDFVVTDVKETPGRIKKRRELIIGGDGRYGW